MDHRTWWPCQSERAHEICVHMTLAEKWGLALIKTAYVAWLGYAVVWRLALLAMEPTAQHLHSVFFLGVLTLAVSYIFASIVKSYLLRTRHGRRYPYSSDELELFTFGHKKPVSDSN